MSQTEKLLELSKTGAYFIYNLDELFKHAKNLNLSNTRLFFACKANPLSFVLETLHEAGIAFDVASIGELVQVLKIKDIKGDNIIMTGPAKTESLIRLGLENKVATVVIESINQLELLQKLSKEYCYNPSILLRLQLKWQENQKSVLGGNEITPFGMDLETAMQALKLLKLPLLGFHVFQWGNCLAAENLRHIWEKTIIACKSLTNDFQVLDLGGGIGIPYTNNEEPLAWSTIENIIQELKNAHKVPEIWLELGRYLTGPYGMYITTVIDIKRTYEKNIIVLEGGVNHLARPALVNQYFPAQLLRSSTQPLINFSLHGPLCTSLDFLGEHLLPKDIYSGDHIVFSQTGAYGFTESMPFFLCHQLPGEAIIKQGLLKIVREPVAADYWLK